MTSTQPVAVALVMPPGPLRDAVVYAFRGLKARVVLNPGDPANWSGLAAALEQSNAELLLFDLACVNEPELEGCIGEIRSRMPHLKIIAAYPYDDPSRRLLAMRAGADEFVHSPVGPALAAVFKRTIESRHTAGSCRATNLERTAVFVLPADCRIEKLHGVIEFLREHHDLVVLDFRTCP